MILVVWIRELWCCGVVRWNPCSVQVLSTVLYIKSVRLSNLAANSIFFVMNRGRSQYTALQARVPLLPDHLLRGLLIYMKFTNFRSHVWKARAFCLSSAVSVHTTTRQNCLPVSCGSLEIYRFYITTYDSENIRYKIVMYLLTYLLTYLDVIPFSPEKLI